MSYQVLFGMEHLSKLDTAVSVCFDTETCQLQPEMGKLRLLQLGCQTRKIIVVIDFFQTDESDWDRLRRFFSNGERHWLAHNAVFDIAWLQEYGIHPNTRFLGCSMLASRVGSVSPKVSPAVFKSNSALPVFPISSLISLNDIGFPADGNAII